MRGALIPVLGGMLTIALGCGFLEDQISNMSAEGLEVTTTPEADEGAEEPEEMGAEPTGDAGANVEVGEGGVNMQAGSASVTTGADGTTTMTDGQGNSVTVGADGTTTATSADGSTTTTTSSGATNVKSSGGNVRVGGRPGIKPGARPIKRGGE